MTIQLDRAALQPKVIRTLVAGQILGGVGMAAGIAVGVLLAEELSGSESMAGFGTTAQVLGSALLAIPVARMTASGGRRVGLRFAYLVAFIGAALVVTAAVAGSFWLMLVGMFLFGGGTTGNNQSRYAAADLAEPHRRGRDLSLVVWATTIGSVLGPNLVGPGKALAQKLGIPDLAGSFVFSLAGFVLAWLVIDRLLRPDPLVAAREIEAVERAALGDDHPARGEEPDHDGSMGRGIRIMRVNKAALQGMAIMALGHLVMVSVMVMTPLHMKHGHAELEIIGFVISMHILGMYALSPFVGQAVDRWGSRPVATVGGLILVLAGVLASLTMVGWSALLLVALFLLGVGWSCTLVSGSTALTNAVRTDERPAAQGLADVCMGLAGAGGGALAGVIVDKFSYPTLAISGAVIGLLAAAVARLTPRST